jgi:YD repeat-containing protein
MLTQVSREERMCGTSRRTRIVPATSKPHSRSLVPTLLCGLLWLQPQLQWRDGWPVLSLPAARADNVQYAYDTSGRLVEAVNTSTNLATEYGYDAVGNIIAIKTLDSLGREYAGMRNQPGPDDCKRTP